MERPKITTTQLHLNCEGALAKLCAISTPEAIASVPDLKEWWAHRLWWLSMTHEERKAILDKEWTYD